MLPEYINQAMRLAKIERLPDGSYYGEIAGFSGVWANANTLEECRNELQSVLEDWLVLGLRLGHPLPEVEGMRLEPGDD